MNLETFYKSKAWDIGYLCQECKRYGRNREAQTVHHIVHLEDDPSLALDEKNLISLCNACHNKAHPEKGGRLF